jgi:hypothetical protein
MNQVLDDRQTVLLDQPFHRLRIVLVVERGQEGSARERGDDVAGAGRRFWFACEILETSNQGDELVFSDQARGRDVPAKLVVQAMSAVAEHAGQEVADSQLQPLVIVTQLAHTPGRTGGTDFLKMLTLLVADAVQVADGIEDFVDASFRATQVFADDLKEGVVLLLEVTHRRFGRLDLVV